MVGNGYPPQHYNSNDMQMRFPQPQRVPNGAGVSPLAIHAGSYRPGPVAFAPSGGYRPGPAIYPPANGVGGYPPNAGYPPNGGGHLPNAGGYPPVAGVYPPTQGGYPPNAGGYPPTSHGYQHYAPH